MHRCRLQQLADLSNPFRLPMQMVGSRTLEPEIACTFTCILSRIRSAPPSTTDGYQDPSKPSISVEAPRGAATRAQFVGRGAAALENTGRCGCIQYRNCIPKRRRNQTCYDSETNLAALHTVRRGGSSACTIMLVSLGYLAQ